MTSSPERADHSAEPVGAVLARWRRRRKLTGQVLGERVGMSQAKISRLENGVVAAEPSDVRLLAEALDLPPDEVDRVVALAEHAENRVTDWFATNLRLADRQDRTAVLEEPARQIRVFQPSVVPGLAQTSEYARAVLSAMPDPQAGDSRGSVSEAVNARIRRSQILDRDDREFRFVITEQVLRNQVGEPAAMVSQVARLRELAAYPNVHVSVVVDGTDLPVAPLHGFYLADDRWVSVDLFNTMVLSKGRDTVRVYRGVFDAFESVARSDIDGLLVDYQARYARMLLPDPVAG